MRCIQPFSVPILPQGCPDHNSQWPSVRSVGDGRQTGSATAAWEILSTRFGRRKTKHCLEHGFGLNQLHTDIVTVAGRLIGFVHAGAAKYPRVKYFNIMQLLAVVLGTRGPE